MSNNSELAGNLSTLRKAYLKKFHTSKDSFFVASIFAGLFFSEKYRARSSDLEKLTHFTPNSWDWRQSQTHKKSGLKVIKYLDLDIDLKPADPETRQDYLRFFSQKCKELQIKPLSILRSPSGYRIAFQLKYPVFANNWQVLTLCEEALSLLKDVFQADKSPGLHSFTRLPINHNSIVMLESFNTISLRDILKRTLKPVLKHFETKPSPSPAREKNAGFWALRNNTAYTLGLICRSYGRDITFARDLVQGLGSLDSDRQLQDTLKSAYAHKHHATNRWCQDLCLGESVGEVARRFRILERCTKEETKLRQSEAARKTNDARKKNTRQRIFEAIETLKAQGETPTYRQIKKITGIALTTINANKNISC